MIKLKKPRVIRDWRKRLTSYSFLSIVANLLIAVSVSGLSVLSILGAQVALKTILIFAIPLGIFGLVGRFLDQTTEGGDDE